MSSGSNVITTEEFSLCAHSFIFLFRLSVDPHSTCAAISVLVASSAMVRASATVQARFTSSPAYPARTPVHSARNRRHGRYSRRTRRTGTSARTFERTRCSCVSSTRPIAPSWIRSTYPIGLPLLSAYSIWNRAPETLQQWRNRRSCEYFASTRLQGFCCSGHEGAFHSYYLYVEIEVDGRRCQHCQWRRHKITPLHTDGGLIVGGRMPAA